MSYGSLSGITFGGISSGLDTNSIIKQLIQIEAQPINRNTNRINQLQNQQGLYNQIGSLTSTFASAAGALNTSTAFNLTTASSSDTAVASVSISGQAIAGTYNLTVTQLAQAQKVTSAAQASASNALGQSGSFVINGKAVTVNSSDSLTTVAQSINSASAGVTASVIDGGTNAAYLSLTSQKTGAVNSLQVSNLSGTVLDSLGLLTGGQGSVRETITNGATSFGYTSNTSTIATLLNTTNFQSGAVQINGKSITVSGTDTLQNVADNINLANAGVTATVRTVKDSTTGNTTYKLDIAGASGTPTFVDNNNVLGGLGILQRGYGNQLLAGQDAKYQLDNLSLTSASNTVTNVLPGVTLNLLKSTPSSTTSTSQYGTSTINVVSDTTGIKNKIKSLVDAYNGVVGYVASNSTFDSKTKAAGPLLGDAVARQVTSTLQADIFKQVPGLNSSYNNLTSIGFSVDKSGTLSVDDATLTNALNTNPTAVQQLFNAFGTSANGNITYVGSTSKSVTSGAGTYAVNITQAATQGSYTGPVAQTSASTAPEVLTFKGNLVGSTYNLSLDIGSTASSIVSKINNDSTLKNLVSASLDANGKLQIQSKKYGTTGAFTVVSGSAAANNNSGIGTDSTVGTTVTGLDVAGTINGELATGSGQFLKGNTGNATTEGLQIQYQGATTGAIGSLQYTKGIGAQLSDQFNALTDTLTGLFATTTKGLQTRIDSLNTQNTLLNSQLAKKQQDLKLKFANMESAISKLQQQGNSISKL